MIKTAALTVVIVDDEPDALSLLIRHAATRSELQVVGEARSGIQAVRTIAQTQPSLLLLDVEMPELDGFGVLKELQRRTQPLPSVIFITAYEKYAVRAFEAQALDYLLKPASLQRFNQAIDRCLDSRKGREPDLSRLLEDALQAPPQRLLIRQQGRIVPVPVESIDFVEACGDYVNVWVGKRSFLIERTLTKMEQLLAPRSFVRVHRSTLVNLQRIRELSPMGGGRYLLILQSGQELAVSRSHAHLFRGSVL